MEWLKRTFASRAHHIHMQQIRYILSLLIVFALAGGERPLASIKPVSHGTRFGAENYKSRIVFRCARNAAVQVEVAVRSADVMQCNIETIK